jgi:transposase
VLNRQQIAALVGVAPIKGKPQKLALVACMRKLLVTLNAMLKHNQPWQPQPAQIA